MSCDCGACLGRKKSVTCYTEGCRCNPCRLAYAAWRMGMRRDRCRQLAADPGLRPHGHVETYREWGCRCKPCTRANADYCAGARSLQEWKKVSDIVRYAARLDVRQMMVKLLRQAATLIGDEGYAPERFQVKSGPPWSVIGALKSCLGYDAKATVVAMGGPHDPDVIVYAACMHALETFIGARKLHDWCADERNGKEAARRLLNGLALAIESGNKNARWVEEEIQDGKTKITAKAAKAPQR